MAKIVSLKRKVKLGDNGTLEYVPNTETNEMVVEDLGAMDTHKVIQITTGIGQFNSEEVNLTKASLTMSNNKEAWVEERRLVE
jgi:hypothetical protein